MQPDLARGIHLALAEAAVVLVVALQVLRAEQPGLQQWSTLPEQASSGCDSCQIISIPKQLTLRI